jgi:hypothetical protein
MTTEEIGRLLIQLSREGRSVSDDPRLELELRKLVESCKPESRGTGVERSAVSR